VSEPEGATWRERTMSRVFNAPREVVWRAWTEPEQIVLWWGPRGMTVPLESIDMDVREGGVFRLTMVADGSDAEFPSDMRFREVVEPERLVFAWEAQRGIGSGSVRVTFSDLGDGRTEVTTYFAGFATDEIFAGSKVGWEGQLDKLAALVA
jgi:uncharacterized protein YndB with AHSA1/START domain